MKLTLTAIALAALVATPALAELPKDYPLKNCPVTDDKLDDKPVKVSGKDGTVVYLCCDSCVEDFSKDPDKYAKMVKDAKAKQAKP